MHSYVVGTTGFDWVGVDGVTHRLNRGDALTGDDARKLEQPEFANLLHRCSRVPETTIDDGTPAMNGQKVSAASSAPQPPAPMGDGKSLEN